MEGWISRSQASSAAARTKSIQARPGTAARRTVTWADSGSSSTDTFRKPSRSPRLMARVWYPWTLPTGHLKP